MIGEAGLTTALHERGYVLSERDPDYVVLGETRAYSTEAITRAIRLIDAGARFIATNPDPTGPSPAGLQPATGAVAALISKATGVKPYFVGKPNPLMMREALRAIDAHSETTVMIGDRMDTDIVAGMEAGLQTILVLTGITTREEASGSRSCPRGSWTRWPTWSTTSVTSRGQPAGRQPAGASSGRPPPILSAHRHRTGSHRSEPRTPPKRPRYHLLHRHEPRRLGDSRWSQGGPEGDPAVDPDPNPSSSPIGAFSQVRTGRRPGPHRPRPGPPG